MCSDYNEINTKLYFKNIFTVSTTAQVLSPENADKNDLPDGAVICPGQITLRSNIESYFAQGSSWNAKMSVAVSDDNESTYEPYTTVNRKEFDYSKNKYETWYAEGNKINQDNPFSNPAAEPVTFSPILGTEYKDKKGYAGGAIKAKNIFSAGGTNEQYFEGNEVKWSTNLGEGSYILSSQLNIEGVTIGLTRTGNYLRTSFYSFTDKSDKEFSTSLQKASIRVNVVNVKDISLQRVSHSPDPVSSFPVDLKITVKNNGQVPVKVTSASITSGYSITTVSGFNQEIPAEEQKDLKVRIDRTNPNAPQNPTITLTYTGITCQGSKTETLNFAVSTETGKPDLAPQVSWSPRNPSQGDTVTFTIKDCNSLVNAGEHQTSYVIGTASNVVNIHALGAGQCYTLPPVSVVCNNQISVDVFSDSNNAVDEANEVNNRFIDTIYCNRTGEEGNNCTVTPSYAVFIPPSSKYFKLFCGVISCTNADWKFENLDEHVSKTGDNLGATVTVDANAPPQKGKLIADAKLNEIRYTCSSVIDIIKSECEDFI
ncbi:MAG: CARDB domain-containing protein [Candidatus Micrarchaeia archaeon]